jgi:hypothetical protein
VLDETNLFVLVQQTFETTINYSRLWVCDVVTLFLFLFALIALLVLAPDQPLAGDRAPRHHSHPLHSAHDL